MNYVYEVCNKCGDRYCCRGLCKEMNNYLTTKRESTCKKSFKKDGNSSKIIIWERKSDSLLYERW